LSCRAIGSRPTGRAAWSAATHRRFGPAALNFPVFSFWPPRSTSPEVFGPPSLPSNHQIPHRHWWLSELSARGPRSTCLATRHLPPRCIFTRVFLFPPLLDPTHFKSIRCGQNSPPTAMQIIHAMHTPTRAASRPPAATSHSSRIAIQHHSGNSYKCIDAQVPTAIPPCRKNRHQVK
jgi:hypothetical protein